MISYYTAVMAITFMSLWILCLLVRENGRIQPKEKRLLYLTYALIGISSLGEWAGVQLDGRTDLPGLWLRIAKMVDYCSTPLAGAALATQMNLGNKWQKLMWGTIAGNTLLQIVSLANGCMLTVDEQNHYHHGLLFPLYIGVCAMIILLLVARFWLYGKSFGRMNLSSLYAVVVLVAASVVLQEVCGFRTAYLGLTIGAIFTFMRGAEYSQLEADRYIVQQEEALNTDALTGILSRYAYVQEGKAYAEKGFLPKDLAAFSMDVDGLKTVNDSLGHAAGDELIIGAADCVKQAFPEGKCFRMGGDEFVVLALSMNPAKAQAALRTLEEKMNRWQGEKVKSLHMSAGYALAGEKPGISLEELVQISDKAMYAAKDERYARLGLGKPRTGNGE